LREACAPARRPRLTSFSRLFDISTGSGACWRRSIFPILALFLMTAAFALTKTGRDALYFQRDGFFDLPKAYLGIAILAGPAAGLALTLMRRFGPRGSRIVSTLAMAALQVVYHALAEPGGGALMTTFFMLVPLLYGVLLAQAWLLASDLLEGAPRDMMPRLYSTLGASSMLGGMAGAGLARALSEGVEASLLILLGATALTASAAVMSGAQLSCRVARMANPESGIAPVSGEYPPLARMFGILKGRYPLLLALAGATGSAVGVLIEFQFYWSVADPASTPRDNVTLFASFYLLLNAAALVVQVLVMPVLQRVAGVEGSLLVLPAAMLGGAATVAATGAAIGRAMLRIAESGLKSSIHRVGWEQAFLPLERRARSIAKLLVDGVAARIGEGVAAGILLVWLSGIDRGSVASPGLWIAYTLIGGSALWLVLVARLRPDLRAFAGREWRADIPLPDG
jgi:AAA family ATP:ADP antiporter